MSDYLTNIQPERNTLKYHAVKVGFITLGRALQSASNFEKEVIKEVAEWNEGFSFSMNVLPNGPSLVMQKENRLMKFKGLKKKEDADSIVDIKNLDTAFRMITTQAGAHHIFAEHKIGVVGNIADSMKIMRLLYIVESYLFPKILSKNILKQTHRMTIQKHINRVRIYTVGMLFGK